MRRCSIFAVVFSIWFVASPASALDVGVGGVDVGVDVDVGGNGVSVGVDVDVDGVGGADVGGSVGSGGVSVDVDVDKNGGANAGGSAAPSGPAADTGVGNTAGPVAGAKSPGGVSPANTSASTGAPKRETHATGRPSAKAAVKPAKPLRSARYTISLPPTLLPRGGERPSRGAHGYPARSFSALPVRTGVAPALVRSCRLAIAAAARPLGAIRVEAVSAGRQRLVGKLVHAPLAVRIQYARQGGLEIRQAKVSCRVNASGRVIAVR